MNNMAECDVNDCVVVDGFNNQQKYLKEVKQELEELKETFAKVNSSFLEEFALAKAEGKCVGAKEVLDFVLSKQPKDLVVSCICGDIKLMIDKKELEEFVKGVQ